MQNQNNGKPSNEKIMVALSGGVDSSVSAFLLLEQGYEIEALFMKNWEEDDDSEYCTAMRDYEDAKAVADKLGIRLHLANFAHEYWENVFEHFLKEYQQGRTPNPDILCNREIKFKVFLEYARRLGAEKIATGHYVQLNEYGAEYGAPLSEQNAFHEKVQLMKGLDPNKDQSYFLHAVKGSELSQTLFPVGGLLKTEVRNIAKRLSLKTHDKKDSTGICFIGERKFRDFLKRYLPAQPGPIQTTEGKTIGKHQGLMYYTLGQRQGLHIGGVKNQPEAPWYVLKKDLTTNTLTVGQGQNHPMLYSQKLVTRDISWINEPPNFPYQCHAKTRYRQSDQPCTIHATCESLEVQFESPQRSVTPGQSVVFYDGNICLGGGIIEDTFF